YPVLRVSALDQSPATGRIDLAAGAVDPADSVHRGSELVPGGARRVRARSRPDHGFRPDAVVLSDADLLSGEQTASRRGGCIDEESDLRPGPRIPVDFLTEPGTRIRR